MESLIKLLGRYRYVSDSSDIGLRQGTVLFLLFHGEPIRKVDQLLQNCLAYADDFTAEEVVQWDLKETENKWDLM